MMMMMIFIMSSSSPALPDLLCLPAGRSPPCPPWLRPARGPRYDPPIRTQHGTLRAHTTATWETPFVWRWMCVCVCVCVCVWSRAPHLFPVGTGLARVSLKQINHQKTNINTSRVSILNISSRHDSTRASWKLWLSRACLSKSFFHFKWSMSLGVFGD